MLNTFSFGSNLSIQKGAKAEIIGIYFIGTIVGLFCTDKLPNEKVFNIFRMSKLTKTYFNIFDRRIVTNLLEPNALLDKIVQLKYFRTKLRKHEK